LSADFSKLGDDISGLESAGASMIHCDIMDGHFVPNISFGPHIVKRVNEITGLPLDVHLMIDNPERFIADFKKAGADYLSVHLENNIHLQRIISQIKDSGIKAGVAINPSSPVCLLHDILPFADFILVMSVNPGFGGQTFIKESLIKIAELKSIIKEKRYNCLLEVDGGINLQNIKQVSDSGADILVAGASIFSSENKSDTIKQMIDLINQ
jgi:ribulose-phosphate 3-epimerase